MEIDITKLGERGQIVIPQEMRNQLHLKKGEKFLVVRSDSKIIFEPIRKMKAKIIEKVQDDLIDMKIAAKRLKEIEEGKCKTYNKKEFLEELKKW